MGPFSQLNITGYRRRFRSEKTRALYHVRKTWPGIPASAARVMKSSSTINGQLCGMLHASFFAISFDFQNYVKMMLWAPTLICLGINTLFCASDLGKGEVGLVNGDVLIFFLFFKFYFL